MEQSSTANNNSQSNVKTENNSQSTWFDSFEPDLKSYVQTKGFESPKTLADSYRNLEKLSGGDRKNLVKLPDDIGSDEMTPIWERLGRPKEAKEYLFDLPDEVKPFIPEEDLNQTKEFFLKNNFTRKQAEGFMKMYLDRLHGQIKTQKETSQQKLGEDSKALEKSWGQAFKENQGIVSNTATKLGINADEWQAIQNSLGLKRAHEIIYNAGKGLRESDFIGSGKGADTKTSSTVDEAKSEIKQLMKDNDFSRRLSSGDVEARKRWDRLHEMAYS